MGAAGAPQGGNFRRRRRQKEGNQGAAGAPGGRFRCLMHGRGFEGTAGAPQGGNIYAMFVHNMIPKLTTN